MERGRTDRETRREDQVVPTEDRRETWHVDIAPHTIRQIYAAHRVGQAGPESLIIQEWTWRAMVADFEDGATPKALA